MRAAGRAPSPPALTRPVLATCAKGGRPLVGDEAQKSAPDVHGQPRQQIALVTRRHQLGVAAVAAAALASLASPLPEALAADDFITTPSGLRYLDLRPGEGATPQPGDVCVVDWAGYTKGYQGKRVGNTTKNEEPYVFTLGAHEVGAARSLRAWRRATGSSNFEPLPRASERQHTEHIGRCLSHQKPQRLPSEVVPALTSL